jgi:hypothetical protein
MTVEDGPRTDAAHAMKKTTTTVALALVALQAACSTTGTEIGVEDSGGYKTMVSQREASNAKIKKDARSIPKIMQDFDRAIDKYFGAVSKLPDTRAKTLRDTLERILRQEARRNFYLLLSMADNQKQPADRGIALIAIGFADATEEVLEKRTGTKAFHVTIKQKRVIVEANKKYTRMALDTMITALNDEDDKIVENALLGLGILGHEGTPVREIGTLLENDKKPLSLRRNASWALTVIQPKLTPLTRRAIRPILQRLLLEPLGAVDPTIACPTLRSLGLFRNKADAKIVEPYCEHPEALVRVRAAIALGMIMNQDSFPILLGLIKPSETNLNVRLVARKSLKALAGGKDRGYDVKEWQKLFKRK